MLSDLDNSAGFTNALNPPIWSHEIALPSETFRAFVPYL